MSKPRTYQTEAIIIKKVKLGEADRILTVYTPQLGKIRAIAKGVRRPKSKMAGHLELLTHSLVSLARGRNLDTITGCQTINSFLPLKTNLERTASAFMPSSWLTSLPPTTLKIIPSFFCLA
jgi:DNA repair protein RecO (recombination protein O)